MNHRKFFSILLIGMLLGMCILGSRMSIRQPEVKPEQQLSSFNRGETLFFWYADSSLTDFISLAAVEFGERENCHIFPILVEDSEFVEAINAASVFEDDMPDVYLLSNEALEKAYLAGLASEISDETGICDTTHFPAAAISAVTYHDKKIAYPLFFETTALLYNETYILEWAEQQAYSRIAGEDEDETAQITANKSSTEEELSAAASVDPDELSQLTENYYANAIPGTLEDILSFADSFDLPSQADGVFLWDVSDVFYNYWVLGAAMNVGGQNGDDSEQISINNETAVACLESYQSLPQFFSIESDTIDYQSVLSDFMNGKMVFTIATTDAAGVLAEAKEDGSLEMDYGFASMPDVSETLAGRTVSVTTAVVVNGYSEHSELANRFAAYLADECANMLYDRTGHLAARTDTYSDRPDLLIFVQEYEKSIALPKMLRTENFWMKLEAMFAGVWNGADISKELESLEESVVSQ